MYMEEAKMIYAIIYIIILRNNVRDDVFSHIVYDSEEKINNFPGPEPFEVAFVGGLCVCVCECVCGGGRGAFVSISVTLRTD